MIHFIAHHQIDQKSQVGMRVCLFLYREGQALQQSSPPKSSVTQTPVPTSNSHDPTQASFPEARKLRIRFSSFCTAVRSAPAMCSQKHTSSHRVNISKRWFLSYSLTYQFWNKLLCPLEHCPGHPVPLPGADGPISRFCHFE